MKIRITLVEKVITAYQAQITSLKLGRKGKAMNQEIYMWLITAMTCTVNSVQG